MSLADQYQGITLWTVCNIEKNGPPLAFYSGYWLYTKRDGTRTMRRRTLLPWPGPFLVEVTYGRPVVGRTILDPAITIRVCQPVPRVLRTEEDGHALYDNDYPVIARRRIEPPLRPNRAWPTEEEFDRWLREQIADVVRASVGA